jgi:addiction module RelB/DinJ family antitoxin
MATVQVRMSDEDKEVTERILKSMGLDATTAVRMYFAQIRIDGCLPFTPNTHLTVNGFTPEFEEEVLKSAAEEEGSISFETGAAAVEYLRKIADKSS